jgi:hypothetical protein
MIFTDTIQHDIFLWKKSDILVWTFFHNVFWLQCPSIRHFRRMFFKFRFLFYPIWNRWYTNTEICRNISQDLAIVISSHSLQFLFNCYYNTFSFSWHCLESLLNEILKLHCKKHTRQFATHLNLSTFHNKLTQRCLAAGSSGNRNAWQAFQLTRVLVRRSSDNRGSTVYENLCLFQQDSATVLTWNNSTLSLQGTFADRIIAGDWGLFVCHTWNFYLWAIL